MKYLYKYPQAEFPYEELIAENGRRSKLEPEYELIDTGIFNESRYFDVFVEYAKAAPDDILIEITAHNRGPDAARLDLLPTIWFRNMWSWDDENPKARNCSCQTAKRRTSSCSITSAARAICILKTRQQVLVHRKRNQHRAAVR